MKYLILILISSFFLFLNCNNDNDQDQPCNSFSSQHEWLRNDEIILLGRKDIEDKIWIVVQSKDSTANIGMTDFVRIFFDINQNGMLDSNDQVFESSNALHSNPCQISHLIEEAENNCINNNPIFEFVGFMIDTVDPPINHRHAFWRFRDPIEQFEKNCEVHFAVQIISNDKVYNYPNLNGTVILNNVFIYD